ncbi:NAD(+)/NADH kinase [Chlamydiifrater phoenicopteri]|uniref:NAD(+)/NADH kinase n=1 Tax=Chlamydiifrater phoenicopteri TaxID=2681469 RepID=UPI001BCC52A2|nr:NAD(+)/NADH kinase [Chlamydiifrater phoenicopteri]
MTIIIFGNPHNPAFAHAASKVQELLSRNGKKAVTIPECSELLRTPSYDSYDLQKEPFESILSIGGDGTVLRAKKLALKLSLPIIGVHIGRLGFMSDLTMDDTDKLEAILQGKGTTVNKELLEGSLLTNDSSRSSTESSPTTHICLNDIVIHRGSFPRLTDYKVLIDGVLLNTFSADGLVLATPNGSTGYSLAAGGPLICPGVQVCVLSPICSHAPSSRPIIICPQKSIEVILEDGPEGASVFFDGQDEQILQPKQSLICKLSPKKLSFLKSPGYDYFVTLRSKLHWMESLR